MNIVVAQTCSSPGHHTRIGAAATISAAEKTELVFKIGYRLAGKAWIGLVDAGSIVAGGAACDATRPVTAFRKDPAASVFFRNPARFSGCALVGEIVCQLFSVFARCPRERNLHDTAWTFAGRISLKTVTYVGL